MWNLKSTREKVVGSDRDELFPVLVGVVVVWVVEDVRVDGGPVVVAGAVDQLTAPCQVHQVALGVGEVSH